MFGILLLILGPLVPPPAVELGPLSYDVSPRSVQFGTVECGAETTREVRIRNNGRVEIVVMKLTSSEPYGAIGLRDEGRGGWEAPGGDGHSVTVVFQPTKEGHSYSGTVSFVIGHSAQQVSNESNRIRRLLSPEIERQERKLHAMKLAGPDFDVLETLKVREAIERETKSRALQARVDASGVELDALLDEKKSALREFRDGAFCSGCQRTKSQIERSGERFPHPGQRVVVPTLAQISEKESEFDRKIQAARNRIGLLRSGFATIESDWTVRIAALDARKQLVEDLWKDQVRILVGMIEQDVDLRTRLLRQLGDLESREEEVSIVVKGNCKNP